MKKIILAIIFLLSINSQVFAEASDVKIYVLGEKVLFDNKPQIVNGNTLVPMRPLFEALGATVAWNEKDQLVTGTRGSLSTQVYINQTTAYAGKNSIELEEAPRIIDGSTYVPLRFIAESFGIDVTWDPANNAINVGKPYDAKDISKIASAAVVYIETLKNNKPFASGSGFITDANGVVVTNYHVIDGSTSAIARTLDGKVINIRSVINYDKERDIAILQLENTSALPTVILGDSDKISNGDKIFAIGSPKGLENTITTGLISNKNRIQNQHPFIQLSAEITHGSSGGALFNERAQVIGITSAGVGEADLNFAIPINELKKITGTKNISLSDINKNEHTIIYNDSVYEGDIRNGLPNGFGKMTFKNGDKVIGDFKNGIIDGNAIYTWSNGASYSGEWVLGVRSGNGIDKDIYGNIYEGQFSNNLANGKGTLKFANGETYVGMMKDSKMEGYGTYTYRNGQSLYGLWSNNMPVR